MQDHHPTREKRDDEDGDEEATLRVNSQKLVYEQLVQTDMQQMMLPMKQRSKLMTFQPKALFYLSYVWERKACIQQQQYYKITPASVPHPALIPIIFAALDSKHIHPAFHSKDSQSISTHWRYPHTLTLTGTWKMRGSSWAKYTLTHSSLGRMCMCISFHRKAQSSHSLSSNIQTGKEGKWSQWLMIIIIIVIFHFGKSISAAFDSPFAHQTDAMLFSLSWMALHKFVKKRTIHIWAWN